MSLLALANFRTHKRGILVFALFGMLLPGSPASTHEEDSARSDERPRIAPILQELSGELVLDGVGLTGDAIRGLVILNLDKARFSEKELARYAPLSRDSEFQRRLCEQCKKRDSTFGAYVLLNTLYPEKRLNLVTGQIDRTSDGMRDVPIKIVSGDRLFGTRISQEQFGVIVYEYWRRQFGIESEAEQRYNEMLRRAEQKKSDLQDK